MRPALKVKPSERAAFFRALERAGYQPHDGPRLTEPGEVGAYRAVYGSRGKVRQCHVQLMAGPGGDLEVRAHTEPVTEALVEHAVSTLLGDYHYRSGSRKLRADLRRSGYHVKG